MKRSIALLASLLTLMGAAVLALAVSTPVAYAATGDGCTLTVGDSSSPGHLNAAGICVALSVDVIDSDNTYGSCAEYNAHGIYDIPRSDPRYRSNMDRDGDGRACEREEGRGNNDDRDRDRRDGRWNYDRDCRFDVPFRNSRDDVRRWCDDWDHNHRTPTTTTTTTTVQAPAPTIINNTPPAVTYGIPRGSVNTGGYDALHAA